MGWVFRMASPVFPHRTSTTIAQKWMTRLQSPSAILTGPIRHYGQKMSSDLRASLLAPLGELHQGMMPNNQEKSSEVQVLAPG